MQALLVGLRLGASRQCLWRAQSRMGAAALAQQRARQQQQQQQQQQQRAASSATVGSPSGTGELHISGHETRPPLPPYRTIDAQGRDVEGAQVPHPLGRETARDIYSCMQKLKVMDTFFYEAQRQGRTSFYLTSFGEEAVAVASAAALEAEDTVFAQYREQGVLLWRGYTLRQFADQLYGNSLEPGKGRQMPIHYGSAAHHFQTISSPLATQIPHSVGAALACKLEGSKSVVACFFGEGAASEGDAHAAFNFASVLGVPVIFLCRNNGWAISTPTTEQYKGDGVVSRAPGYGMASARVDGGDAQAVFNAVREARLLAVKGCQPVLVELMCYRAGHHSTSDDSSRYRDAEDLLAWSDPVDRFRTWLTARGWWSDAEDLSLSVDTRKQVSAALAAAAKEQKPALSEMFNDVYANLPWHLEEQREEAYAAVRRHPELLPPGVPLE